MLFAKEILRAGNPIGVTFRATRGKPQEKVYQIVRLVGNTKYPDDREGFQPTIFLAESQDAEPDAVSTLVIRLETRPSRGLLLHVSSGMCLNNYRVIPEYY